MISYKLMGASHNVTLPVRHLPTMSQSLCVTHLNVTDREKRYHSKGKKEGENYLVLLKRIPARIISFTGEESEPAIKHGFVPCPKLYKLRSKESRFAMPKKSFHLRWNNHLQNLQNLFENIFDEQSFVDVTISCSDGVLYGHKLVLSACSPYFEQVFKGNPCKHPIMILKGVSKRDMRFLLEYMYKGSVDVGEEDLEMMLDTATELQIKGLVQTTASAKEFANQNSKCNETPIKEQLPSAELIPPSVTQHCDSLIWQAELVAKPSSSKHKESEVKQVNQFEEHSPEKCSSIPNSDSEIDQHKENIHGDESVFNQHNMTMETEKDFEETYEQEEGDYNAPESLNESQDTMQTNYFRNNELPNTLDINWVCHTCPRQFGSKNSYQRHMMTHAGVKPHHCTFCNQSFLRLSHLQRHVRVHTGERPYACAQCPKQFARSDKLRQHYIIQHSHDATTKPRGRPRKHFMVLDTPSLQATSNMDTSSNSPYSVSINPIPMSAV